VTGLDARARQAFNTRRAGGCWFCISNAKVVFGSGVDDARTFARVFGKSVNESHPDALGLKRS
jgi:hypothetical protein